MSYLLSQEELDYIKQLINNAKDAVAKSQDTVATVTKTLQATDTKKEPAVADSRKHKKENPLKSNLSSDYNTITLDVLDFFYNMIRKHHILDITLPAEDTIQVGLKINRDWLAVIELITNFQDLHSDFLCKPVLNEADASLYFNFGLNQVVEVREVHKISRTTLAIKLRQQEHARKREEQRQQELAAIGACLGSPSSPPLGNTSPTTEAEKRWSWEDHQIKVQQAAKSFNVLTALLKAFKLHSSDTKY